MRAQLEIRLLGAEMAEADLVVRELVIGVDVDRAAVDQELEEVAAVAHVL